MTAAPDILSVGGMKLHVAPGVSVAELAIGRPVGDVFDLLPRIFNLCRSAQRMALQLALGIPHADGEDEGEALRAEVLRDHLLRFGIILPGRLGLPPTPPVIAAGEAGVRQEFLGDQRLPETWEAFEAVLGGSSVVSRVLGRLRRLFAPGEAAVPVLPAPSIMNPLEIRAAENSCAARHVPHPLMREIEARWGRGPLWRATGRALDLESCFDRALPQGRRLPCGTAFLPAARGAYALAATARNGVVTSLRRVTPTDQMLAPGGVLMHTLETLPERKSALAALVIDILDPCLEVRVLEVDHA